VEDLGNVDVLVTHQQCIPSGSKQARKQKQQWRSVMSEMALSQNIKKNLEVGKKNLEVGKKKRDENVHEMFLVVY
jgi:hypothetical protein